MIPNAGRAGLRRGITLIEILISILILGVGLVSLATLFPIGLLRLREAQRQTRSAYLYESAAADVAARGLLKTGSFAYADLLNTYPPNTFNPWFYSRTLGGSYDPLVQDTPYYTGDPFANGPPIYSVGAASPASGGYGLPFAYDPLWRWQTDQANGGIYLNDTTSLTYGPNYTPETRFAAGDALRALTPNDNDGNGPPSAYGLQRLTNFNRPTYINSQNKLIPAVMPAANFVSTIFVSPEDVVWQEATNTNNVYTIGGVPRGDSGSIPSQPGRARPQYSVVPGAAQ